MFNFILGIFFVSFILPIINSLESLIYTKIQTLIAKLNVIINDCNLQIDNQESQQINAIGFQNFTNEGVIEDE